MNSFALYRLPRQTVCTLVEQDGGDVQELSSCAELNGRQGFVVAPFSVTTAQPIVLIRPDRVVQYDLASDGLDELNCQFPVMKLPVCRNETQGLLTANSADAVTYAADFKKFHDRLVDGTFRKIVLSRCATIAADGPVQPLDLFRRVCRRYPRLFVSLVYTPKSGLWLTATPEILLEGVDNRWRTIALAGTMKLQGDELQGEGEHVRWSTKNIEEQRLVATYLAEQLKPFAADISEEGPRTVRAAHLVHLRSDFTFTLLINTRVGDLLQALHPTPAVCGLPKQEAFRFILQHEHSPRSYYSGFMGPLDLAAHTHLYVSLRCMQILPDAYRLYAGGGLLKDSIEEQEWQETEAKMETMQSLLV